MRRAAVGLLVASLFVSRPASAAPPVAEIAKASVGRVAPAAIDSEASLEFFIGQASRLVKGDTSKDLAALSSRLETLKTQKGALQQKILEKEREIAGAQAAAAAQAEKAARAQHDSLKAQLANVDVAIKDLLLQIQRLEDEAKREQDEIKAAEDALDRLSRSLVNAALQRTTIAGAISSVDAFARGLSAAKKRETEDRIRRALAQLAEARRLRLSLAASAAGPAFRVAPKPGQKN